MIFIYLQNFIFDGRLNPWHWERVEVRPGGTGPVGGASAGPFSDQNTPFIKIILFFKTLDFYGYFWLILPKSFSKNAPNCISKNLNFNIFKGYAPGTTSLAWTWLTMDSFCLACIVQSFWLILIFCLIFRLTWSSNN